MSVFGTDRLPANTPADIGAGAKGRVVVRKWVAFRRDWGSTVFFLIRKRILDAAVFSAILVVMLVAKRSGGSWR
jgi:hypothetical protein